MVFKVTARDLGTEAEVVTLNQGTRVLLMYPLVGMEATQAIAWDRGTAKPAAQTVVYSMLAWSRPVPSAMQEFAKVILMRAVCSGTRLVIWVKKY